MFNIVKEHCMRAIAPLVLRISMNAKVLTKVKAVLHNGINIATEVITLFAFFVKKQEQIPIRVFVPVTTGTRTIEVEFATFGKYACCYLTDVIDDLFTFHISHFYAAKIRRIIEISKFLTKKLTVRPGIRR